MIVPVMLGWMLHLYVNVPAEANVAANVWSLLRFALLVIEASSNVTVCAESSLFVQVSDPPAATVEVAGIELEVLRS